MSYDVSLIDENGYTVKVPRHREGGTQVLFVVDRETGACSMGTDDAWLNVTWNYSQDFRKHLHIEGLKYLHEKKAKDVIELLEKAIGELGTERSDDYWEPTPGNAGYALNILLGWAKQCPDATFTVY